MRRQVGWTADIKTDRAIVYCQFEKKWEFVRDAKTTVYTG